MCRCHIPTEDVQSPSNCLVCAGKHTSRNSILVPDLKRKAMINAHFCSKHMPPAHEISFIHNSEDLYSVVRKRMCLYNGKR